MFKLKDTKFLYVFFFSAILALNLVSCGDDDGNGVGPDTDPDTDPGEDQTTVVDLIQDDDELSVLTELINENDLEIDLAEDGPFTIFAPTDSVLDANDLTGLSSEQLKAVLMYHVISADLSAEDISETEQAFQTLQEDSLYISNRTQPSRINNTTVVLGSQEAKNVKIHKIDDILLPDANHNIFDVIFKRYQTHKFACTCTSGRTGLAADLRNTDTQFTVFVPTNQAFESRADEIGDVDDMTDMELTQLMEHHVIEGSTLLSSDLSDGQTLTTKNGEEITISVDSENGTVMVNGEATVKTADIEGINGVIHIIDHVLEVPE